MLVVSAGFAVVSAAGAAGVSVAGAVESLVSVDSVALLLQAVNTPAKAKTTNNFFILDLLLK